MKAKHYSPQLSRELISQLYFAAKQKRIPMTILANEYVRAGLTADGRFLMRLNVRSKKRKRRSTTDIGQPAEKIPDAILDRGEQRFGLANAPACWPSCCSFFQS